MKKYKHVVNCFKSGLIATVYIASMTTFAVADDNSPDTGLDPAHGDGSDGIHRPPSLSAELEQRDEIRANIVSSGPDAKVIKNLDLAGRGERNVAQATTDVWVHNGYAYTGTFNSPCGGDPEAGIWVWDVHNKNKISFVTVIPSPVGSRTNDVRVLTMNSGDILVHSNESCAGGPGGFEVYNVNDPENPVYLASVQTDDVNLFLQDAFGFVDIGVHNLWLFTQGERDYVAATVESLFGNFQIFDITDPTSPVLTGFWGAEQSPNAVANGVPSGVDWVNTDDFEGVIIPGNNYNTSGFGASANRFLHDITINEEGTLAYLANWDEGMVLLDISDPSNPVYISTAIDVENGSLDGEVNSHSMWPSEDGTIVVEGEEDFSAWEANVAPSNLTLDGTTAGDPTIPGTAVSTLTGDDFEANQTGNTGSTDGATIVITDGPLAGNSYSAVELSTAAASPTFADTGSVTGEFVWIGRACTATAGDGLENTAAFDTGDIAVVRRGACEFEEKANAAASLGAAAVVIANNLQSTPWSGLRIWDYSDPTNPILASIFDTECSASSEPSENCDPAGTYSVHNVQVETLGNKVLAYVSWYSDGMLVLDVSDPYAPVEIARFLDDSTNGGNPIDFWGVHKEKGSPWFFGSDRNGGLYSFKLKGSGSGKN